MAPEVGKVREVTRHRHFWPAALAVVLAFCGAVVAVRAGAVRVHDASRAIDLALQDQGEALLRGDAPGWLRPVDQSQQTEMRRLYDNLRGLEVSAWLPRATSLAGDDSLWRAAVQVRVCFTGTRCVRAHNTYVPLGDVITAATVWRVSDDHAVLESFLVSAPMPAAAVPWKTKTLNFATGSRVIVAASSGSMQPAQWVAVADRAAQIADKYAFVRPGKYVIYLAAADEWQTVIGEDGEALGFVDRTSEQTAFTVVDAAEQPSERLLRHELGHVATLLGTLGGQPDWAIEGMAEYVAWEQTPMSSYRLTQAARDHIARTQWQGRLDLPWSSQRTERVGFYAMAYLAIRCLASTYGEASLLSFFDRVARQNRSPAEAALPAFGTPWPAVEEACHAKIEGWLS